MTLKNINDFLRRYLVSVSKPGRYVGGEFNQVSKNWTSVDLHVALAFPDIYDIGFSNLGLSILYDTINNRTDALAERVYSPWTDMEELMRTHAIPLYALESKTPIARFDVLGISLPYESLYTNLLNILDLSGIPLHSNRRTACHPIVIAGGHACYNPEPIHTFIDAFVIGEGEEIIHEVLNEIKLLKSAQASRQIILDRLGKIGGMYIPSFFKVNFYSNGLIKNIANVRNPEDTRIRKRIVNNLPAPIIRNLVPNIKTVHERVVIEIMRGCSRGCRFCQAGMITRPVRERSTNQIIKILKEAISYTGFTDVSLLSLSASDHSQIAPLIEQVMQLSKKMRFNFSLPSLRIESFQPSLIKSMLPMRKGNFTIAPEAGSDEMRSRINKPIPHEDVLKTANQIFKMGWTNLKLYFMIGFPDETITDIEKIIDLCKQIKSLGKKIIGGRLKIHVSINTFIPKPHTPFQWTSFTTKEKNNEKYRFIHDKLKKTGIKIDWPSYENSFFEAWLSRGDRRLATVVETAWKKGAKFDAWHECFDIDKWLQAFNENDIDPNFYTTRERSIEEVLPWDHIDTGISRNFLISEFEKSQILETTQDCRTVCHACGIQTSYHISCEGIRNRHSCASE